MPVRRLACHHSYRKLFVVAPARQSYARTVERARNDPGCHLVLGIVVIGYRAVMSMSDNATEGSFTSFAAKLQAEADAMRYRPGSVKVVSYTLPEAKEVCLIDHDSDAAPASAASISNGTQW